MNYEIVIDHGETGNKCTIAPLSDRPDFKFFRVHGEKPIGPLSAPILLHHEGECLSRFDRQVSVPTLLTVDCVWRRLPGILRRLTWVESAARPAKIPSGFVTAYPRVSKHWEDPAGGLATIEAVFVATALLGKWDLTLLSRYHFARAFVSRNAELFVSLGVTEAADPSLWPPEQLLVRTSQTRKRNRWRAS